MGPSARDQTGTVSAPATRPALRHPIGPTTGRATGPTRPGNGRPPAIGVLADDLTGAHASAARLREAGVPTIVAWRRRAFPPGTVGVSIDMRTRDYGASPDVRARRWARYLRALGIERIELRSDSTLRGEPAAELAGVLRGLGDSDMTVLAVPAFPSAGRTVRHGRLQAGQIELPESRRDIPARLFAERGGRAVIIDEAVVRDGRDAVTGVVLEAVADGRRLFVADSVDEADLRVVADAAATLELTAALPGGLLTVSPGAWLAYRHLPGAGGYVLVVLSSNTAVNSEQLAVLADRHPSTVLAAAGVLNGRAGVRAPEPGSAIVVETLSTRARDDAEAWAQSAVAARAAGLVLKRVADAGGPSCDGIVCGGGQTASALMDRLDAGWLDCAGELAPLCPLSRMCGGRYDGLRVVTKGGLVGDAETLTRLVVALSRLPAEGIRAAPA